MFQPHQSRQRTPRRPVWPARVVAIALVLGGGALMGQPVVETLVQDAAGGQQSTALAAAVRQSQQDDPAALDARLAEARAYNEALSPSSLTDPWGDPAPGHSPAHDAYAAQLDDFDAMGRIIIEQIGVDLPIHHDATSAPLARGAGHMFGTSLPVGGPDTHAVIAAHTGMRSRTMFDRLPQVQVGQTFVIETYGSHLTYRIDQMRVVEPWQLQAVARIPGDDLVTLVTCYTPPGEHKQRLLVRGVRVPEVPADGGVTTADGATSQVTAARAGISVGVQDWMWPRIVVTVGAVALAGAMVWSWTTSARRGGLR